MAFPAAPDYTFLMDRKNPAPNPNIALCAKLIASGKLRAAPLNSIAAEALPLAGPLDPDRVAGMLLGLAVGDSLGNTSESMLPRERRARYGEIRDYLPNRHAEGRAVGLPSDDTQMTFWALEKIMEDDGVDPARLSDRFARSHIFGIGRAVSAFQTARSVGIGWESAGQDSAGNGSLMRAAPLILPSLMRGGPELAADIVMGSMITHNDSASIASCLAFCLMLRELLVMERPPEPRWWVDRFCGLAAKVETDKRYIHRNTAAYPSFCGKLSDFVREEVGKALDENVPVVDACNRWFSGAYLLETVPSVLYILARHGDDPGECIVRAVNDTWDNDTDAAIVGAAAGALHGRAKLPERWIAGLTGRTGKDDDGKVFELVEKAIDFAAADSKTP
jgi:ADP-ribosylglycohydrolase